MDTTKQIAQDLLNAVKKLNDGTGTKPLRHIEVLKSLTNIFKRTADNAEEEIVEQNGPTLTNLTTPAMIRAAPRVHGRTTRNNTPNVLPIIVNSSLQRVIANNRPIPPPRMENDITTRPS